VKEDMYMQIYSRGVSFLIKKKEVNGRYMYFVTTRGRHPMFLGAYENPRLARNSIKRYQGCLETIKNN
jgi:hypothetical protein